VTSSSHEATLRVGLDLTALLPVPTGVDTYLHQLTVALAELDSATQFTLFVNRDDRAFWKKRAGDQFSVHAWSLRPRPVRLLFQQLLLPALTRLHGVHVVHSPSFIMPMLRGSGRHLLTVYDMTVFSHPECHNALRRSASYRWAIRESLHRADLVTVPSESTRREIRRLEPEIDIKRVAVVRPGIGEEFRPRREVEVDGVRRRYDLARPYVLFLGTLEPRKNLDRLVRAYARLVHECNIDEDLVLAGKPGWGMRSLLTVTEELGVRERVRRPGYVDQESLPALLSGARVFAYPSIAEGFGFPPLEAMACGVPTVASNSTSLGENLAGAAELVAPDDTNGLANALYRLLTDESLRSRLRRRGMERARSFRWEACARRTLACYRRIAGLQTAADVATVPVVP
jgi:glycosyltransferase involved in cell wall biosynthesis